MPPDLKVYNPNGLAAVFQRICYSNSAQVGYGSPGLSMGWTHNYDIAVYGPATSGTWGALTIVYANDAQEALTPVLSGGSPTGAFTVPAGRPYEVTGVPSSTPGQWNSITLTWGDETQWVFTPLNVNGVTEYAFTRITNRTGQSLLLTWNGQRALQTVKDATSGTALLTLAYNANGNLSTVTDAYGRQVDYTFSTDQFTGATILMSVSQIATAPGAPAHETYGYSPLNGSSLLSSVTFPSPTGNGTSMDSLGYDGNGRVIFFTDANGNTTDYTYNGGSTQVQTLSPTGSIVLSYAETYDSMGRETGTSDAAGYDTQIAYTDANNPYKPTQVTDKLGHITTYTYDPYGHVRTKTDSRNVVTTDTWSYSAFPLGRLMEVEIGSRTPTTYTYYEPVGLVKTVVAAIPGGGTGTSTYTYDALGDVTSAATPGNNATATHTITYGYGTSPAAKEPLTVTDELNHVTTLAYTSRGPVQSVKDAMGNETDYTYDLADQLQQITFPATGQQGSGRITYTGSYLYPDGPLMGVTDTDESGTLIRQVTYTRGAEGELLSVAGSTEPVTYTYDAMYRVATLTDGGGHTTHYFYNTLGYLSQIAYPGAGASSSPLAAGTRDTITYTSFDQAGDPLTRMDGNGTTTTYTYNDPCNLLTKIHYTLPSSPPVSLTSLADTSYGYDGYGRRVSMTDATGQVTYSYDDTDHLLSSATTYTGLPTKTIAFGYNPDGSRSSMTTPGGNFSYSYDAAGRMTTLTNPFEAYVYSFTYYNNNWLKSQQSSNVLIAAYTYNAAGEITDLNNHLTNNTALSDFAVPSQSGYDGAGNRTGLTVSLPGVPSYAGSTSYAYDSRDELTQETSTRNGGYSGGYAYDGAENPTTFWGASVGAASMDNQLPGSTYDGDGNPSTYRGAAATFNPENRLTGVGSVTNTYNGDGLRASKNAGGLTYYLYDGDLPVVEMSNTGAINAVHTFGPNGLLARHTAAGSLLYTWDPSGSLVERVTTSGSVYDAALFDGFGARVGTNGAGDPFSGFAGQFGGYYDPQNGLTLFTHREYDTATGRFLTRDPMGYDGGINLYAYARNSPICWADPSGFGVIYIGISGTGTQTGVTGMGGGGIVIQFPGYGSEGGWGVKGYGTVGTGFGIGTGAGVSGNVGFGYGGFTGFEGSSNYAGFAYSGDGAEYQYNNDYYGICFNFGPGAGAEAGAGTMDTTITGNNSGGTGDGGGTYSTGNGGGGGRIYPMEPLPPGSPGQPVNNGPYTTYTYVPGSDDSGNTTNKVIVSY